VKRFLNRFWPKEPLIKPVIGYQRYLPQLPPEKRALLSYLPAPVRQELQGKPEVEFSNRGIARHLTRALNELGYVVDIISWDDQSFRPPGPYDLWVQHGGLNYSTLSSHLGLTIPEIYFSTGSYWKVHNKAERQRFDALAKRQGRQLPYDRLIEVSEEEANRNAAGIIALGNKAVATTYAGFPHVEHINIGCYPDPRPAKHPKVHSDNRRRFVYFAGGGNIHKGLDLVLEAFSRLPHKLTVASHIEPEIADIYRQVFRRENVEVLPPTAVRSPGFYRLMDRSDFVILPSCSEGQPGSVIECMHQGLVPLVTPETHIDLDDYGIQISEGSVESVISSVEAAVRLSAPRLARMSRAAREVTLTRHSPEQFVTSFKASATRILNETPA
jgi:glycosyltransferase involved in cell wall biosynthesis